MEFTVIPGKTSRKRKPEVSNKSLSPSSNPYAKKGIAAGTTIGPPLQTCSQIEDLFVFTKGKHIDLVVFTKAKPKISLVAHVGRRLKNPDPQRRDSCWVRSSLLYASTERRF
jgi:hypothetical protein